VVRVLIAVEVPRSLARSAEHVWGAVGVSWIEELPDTVTALARAWDLTIERLYPLSLHWVAAVTAGDGTPAVLKVGPAAARHLVDEARALRLFDGSGSVRLLREDPSRGALLLERAEPGTTLSSLVPRRDVEATGVVVDVLRALHRTAPAAAGLAPVVAQRGALVQHAGPMPFRLVDRAAGLFRELSEEATQRVVLHGDLHHDNVLRSSRSGWLSIDPHGSVGDPAYDLGSVLFNPDPENRDPALLALVPARIEQLADGLGMSRERATAWGFVKAVLSQAWSCEVPAPRPTRALDVANLLQPGLR
jgi:streptomycin 6-kinase